MQANGGKLGINVGIIRIITVVSYSFPPLLDSKTGLVDNLVNRPSAVATWQILKYSNITHIMCYSNRAVVIGKD